MPSLLHSQLLWRSVHTSDDQTHIPSTSASLCTRILFQISKCLCQKQRLSEIQTASFEMCQQKSLTVYGDVDVVCVSTYDVCVCVRGNLRRNDFSLRWHTSLRNCVLDWAELITSMLIILNTEVQLTQCSTATGTSARSINWFLKPQPEHHQWYVNHSLRIFDKFYEISNHTQFPTSEDLFFSAILQNFQFAKIDDDSFLAHSWWRIQNMSSLNSGDFFIKMI